MNKTVLVDRLFKKPIQKVCHQPKVGGLNKKVTKSQQLSSDISLYATTLYPFLKPPSPYFRSPPFLDILMPPIARILEFFNAVFSSQKAKTTIRSAYFDPNNANLHKYFSQQGTKIKVFHKMHHQDNDLLKSQCSDFLPVNSIPPFLLSSSIRGSPLSTPKQYFKIFNIGDRQSKHFQKLTL